MPRYDYECDSCGASAEFTFRMEEMRETVRCSCGGTGRRAFHTCPEVLVKGNQYGHSLSALDVPVGWQRGNTDPEAYERNMWAQQAALKKVVQENKGHQHKTGIRHIGSIPLVVDRMRRRQFGNDYWQTDIKDKLKRDGCLLLDD